MPVHRVRSRSALRPTLAGGLAWLAAVSACGIGPTSPTLDLRPDEGVAGTWTGRLRVQTNGFDDDCIEPVIATVRQSSTSVSGTISSTIPGTCLSEQETSFTGTVDHTVLYLRLHRGTTTVDAVGTLRPGWLTIQASELSWELRR